MYRFTVVFSVSIRKENMSQIESDERIFYHWSDLMPEDVRNTNRVDLLFKLDDYRITSCRNGLIEIELYGRISRDTKITVHTSCRDAESEPKLHRAYPFTNKICWVLDVLNVDKDENYWHQCFPGSIRIYELKPTIEENKSFVDFPLKETDISSSAMEKIDQEEFPITEKEDKYCMELYEAFFT